MQGKSNYNLCVSLCVTFFITSFRSSTAFYDNNPRVVKYYLFGVAGTMVLYSFVGGYKQLREVDPNATLTEKTDAVLKGSWWGLFPKGIGRSTLWPFLVLSLGFIGIVELFDNLRKRVNLKQIQDKEGKEATAQKSEKTERR